MSPLHPPYAVIFDFDGVLFETEPTHCHALAHVLSEVGISLEWADYAEHYVGLSDREILHRLAIRFAALRDIDLDDLLERKSRKYLETTAHGVPPIDGAPALIGRLIAQSIPRAICSGSRREEIERLLSHAGLANAFDAIVATEDVSASKPSPEGYQLAFRKLNALHPELTEDRCVVIEDAAAGVEAARSARMRVVALTKTYGDNASAAPDARVDSLDVLSHAFVGKLVQSGIHRAD